MLNPSVAGFVRWRYHVFPENVLSLIIAAPSAHAERRLGAGLLLSGLASRHANFDDIFAALMMQNASLWTYIQELAIKYLILLEYEID